MSIEETIRTSRSTAARAAAMARDGRHEKATAKTQPIALSPSVDPLQAVRETLAEAAEFIRNGTPIHPGSELASDLLRASDVIAKATGGRS